MLPILILLLMITYTNTKYWAEIVLHIDMDKNNVESARKGNLFGDLYEYFSGKYEMQLNKYSIEDASVIQAIFQQSRRTIISDASYFITQHVNMRQLKDQTMPIIGVIPDHFKYSVAGELQLAYRAGSASRRSISGVKWESFYWSDGRCKQIDYHDIIFMSRSYQENSEMRYHYIQARWKTETTYHRVLIDGFPYILKSIQGRVTLHNGIVYELWKINYCVEKPIYSYPETWSINANLANRLRNLPNNSDSNFIFDTRNMIVLRYGERVVSLDICEEQRLRGDRRGLYRIGQEEVPIHLHKHITEGLECSHLEIKLSRWDSRTELDFVQYLGENVFGISVYQKPKDVPHIHVEDRHGVPYLLMQFRPKRLNYTDCNFESMIHGGIRPLWEADDHMSVYFALNKAKHPFPIDWTTPAFIQSFVQSHYPHHQINIRWMRKQKYAAGDFAFWEIRRE